MSGTHDILAAERAAAQQRQPNIGSGSADNSSGKWEHRENLGSQAQPRVFYGQPLDTSTGAASTIVSDNVMEKEAPSQYISDISGSGQVKDKDVKGMMREGEIFDKSK